MKNETMKTFKRRLWIKAIIFSLSISICFFFIGFINNRLMPEHSLNLIVAPIVIILMGLSFPLLIKYLAPPRRRTIREYEQAEEALEQSGNQAILQTFGSKYFERLYFEDHDWIPTEAIDICRELLGQEESRANIELRFHIYMKLALYLIKDNQPKAAIRTLQDALSIKPTNLIANYRIAVLYEGIGSGDEASTHYRLAENDRCASQDLQDYLENQIQRIIRDGPRLIGPYDYTGLKWLA